VNDLADVLAHLRRELIREENEPFAWRAAHAFYLAGRPAPALRLLETLLDTTSPADAGPSDGAYELLLELLPRELAAARLEELFARRRLDPAPMLWKAELMLRSGQAEEAERCAREAILVTPFDEDRVGGRAHAWSVLAQALAKRGDPAAESARRRAEAIRFLVPADELAAAGLHTRALAQYRAAHEAFGDDFGIEWKLARALRDLGDLEEANVHWLKAGELLPADLGRHSWRWLNSERVLAHANVRALAEARWPALVAQQPENARAHYALALLHREQDREAEAQQELRRAVALDRDFFDAWDDLSGEAKGGPMAQERAANLIRLDPHRVGLNAELNGRDLRRTWSTVAELAKYHAVPPVALYPLRASEVARRERPRTAEQREAELRRARTRAAMDEEWRYGIHEASWFRRLFSPAAAVMSDPAIAQTAQMMGVAPPYNGPMFHEKVNGFEFPEK
jgi:tetratricopeptide (TPR) repeat protein